MAHYCSPQKNITNWCGEHGLNTLVGENVRFEDSLYQNVFMIRFQVSVYYCGKRHYK